MKFINNVYLMLAISITLSGCILNKPINKPISTPSWTETQLPLPTFVKPTSKPISTSRPVATVTLTPPATLNPEDAKEALKILLQEPMDCPAPCFWGITPGQTTLGEAKNIFTRFGLQIESTTYQGRNFYGIGYDFDSGLSIVVTLTGQKEIIENLRVDITPETQRAEIPREWLAYSPEILIKEYGKPSRVSFALDWGPRSYFEMNLYFDDIDLIVEYIGHNIIPNQKSPSQICPLISQFELVHLWMGVEPVNPPIDAVSLQEATNLTIDEFSDLLLGDPNESCFIVKGDVFP